MAYYGQRPSGQQLQQAAGGNPFYNPYSAYPNIGMGISSILQNVMAQRQFQEQQTYERGVQEREMGQRDRQLDIQEQPTIRATPEWEMEIQAYMRDNPTTNGKPTTQWDAIKGVTEGKRAKTSEDEVIKLSDAEKAFAKSIGYNDIESKSNGLKKSIRARFITVKTATTPVSQTPGYREEQLAKATEVKTEARRKKDESRANAMRTRLEKDIATKQTLLNKTTGTGVTSVQRAALEKEVENIEAVLLIVRSQETTAASRPLEEYEKVLLNTFQRDYHKISTGQVLEKFMNMAMKPSHESSAPQQAQGAPASAEAGIPQEVRDYMAKNPNVPLETAMSLYQEWLKKK